MGPIYSGDKRNNEKLHAVMKPVYLRLNFVYATILHVIYNPYCNDSASTNSKFSKTGSLADM